MRATAGCTAAMARTAIRTAELKIAEDFDNLGAYALSF
jgi:hypothetical protein